jgi:hypothetical protein
MYRFMLQSTRGFPESLLQTTRNPCCKLPVDNLLFSQAFVENYFLMAKSFLTGGGLLNKVMPPPSILKRPTLYWL